MIHTIGYAQLTPAKVAATVHALDAVLIDVRSSPRSRKPGFGGRQLAELLPGRYRHEPALGGRAPVDIGRVRAIAREFDGPDRPNCVLMCLEDLPMHCHRHTAICKPYIPNALHILDGCLFTVEGIQACMDGAEPPEPVGYVVEGA